MGPIWSIGKANGRHAGPLLALGRLAHRVAPILDVGDRIALELISEFSSGHLVLLASKITKQGVYKSGGYSPVIRTLGERILIRTGRVVS